MVGASVYTGLQDLHVLHRAIEAGSLSAEELAEALRRLGRPFDDIAELTNQDLTAVAEELRFVDARLLRLQREIFDDLAWQHVPTSRAAWPPWRGCTSGGDLGDTDFGLA